MFRGTLIQDLQENAIKSRATLTPDPENKTKTIGKKTMQTPCCENNPINLLIKQAIRSRVESLIYDYIYVTICYISSRLSVWLKWPSAPTEETLRLCVRLFV